VTEAHVLSPYKVSPSRVNALLSCGIAFKLKYEEKLPEETSGSAALFGSVVHQALEVWGVDRSQPLLPLMQDAWEVVTEGTAAGEFVKVYKRLSVEAIRTKHAIVEARKKRGIDTKVVTMTGDWKKSHIAKRISHLLRDWIPRLEADPKTIWRFTERDPLPGLYDESLPLARRYEERWKHLPNVIHSEFKASVTWKEWEFDCRIDAIEPLVDKDTGEVVGVGVTDYKTYRNEPAEHKDWRQVTMYDRGVSTLLDQGVLTLPPQFDGLPILVGVDYVRLGTRRYWQLGQEDFDRLERELTDYTAIVSGKHYLPAEKGRNVDFCPYPSQCCLGTCLAAGGRATPVEVNL
jgi:hypothetical protein